MHIIFRSFIIPFQQLEVIDILSLKTTTKNHFMKKDLETPPTNGYSILQNNLYIVFFKKANFILKTPELSL